MSSYLTQEDGTSRLTLEDSSGFLILEEDPAPFFPAGSLGCTSTKSAGQTLSINPSRNVPMGSIVVVWAAWIGDRFYDDAAGLMDSALACTDSEGNTYSTIAGGLYDASSFMFVAYVSNPLTTSSTITLTHRSNALTAKAMCAEEFEIGQDKRFAVWRDREAAAEYYQGQTLQGVTNSGLDSGTEYLLLHCLANLRPSTDTYSYDSDYTPITGGGTTGGADTSNITLLGGYRFVTGITGDTVSVSDTTASTTQDSWQQLVAISIIEYDARFPTFPDLDDFNRADEDPVGLPKWKDAADSGPGFQQRRIRVTGNEAAASVTTGPGSGAQFWNESIPPGDDGEMGFRVADIGNGGPAVAHIFASGSGENSTLSGYGISWQKIDDARQDLARYGESGNAGAIGSRYLNVWAPFADDNQVGIQMRESGVVVQLWLDLSGGGEEWEWVSAQHKTAFVSNGGLAGLDFRGDLALRIDDFFAGTSTPFLPQIFRRIPTAR